MRSMKAFVALALAAALFSGPAYAVGIAPDEPQTSSLVARVDLSRQRMTVYIDDVQTYVFPVSTGRGTYGTPTGRYKAEWLSPRHRTRKYNNAPMPFAIFFYEGYAIHGTTDIKHLGSIASHGCVRLHPDNAKELFALVQQVGMDHTVIRVRTHAQGLAQLEEPTVKEEPVKEPVAVEAAEIQDATMADVTGSTGKVTPVSWLGRGVHS